MRRTSVVTRTFLERSEPNNPHVRYVAVLRELAQQLDPRPDMGTPAWVKNYIIFGNRHNVGDATRESTHHCLSHRSHHGYCLCP